jgi:V/A-type H+-transporting ATPase subunit B
MYSDLASLFERAGVIRGAKGTLTQLSILTMPADDIGTRSPTSRATSPRARSCCRADLDRRAVYPPIDVLPSLSRLMKDGTGGKYTHPDHPALSSQLYAAYARAVQARVLASVVGEEGLSAIDRQYLVFGSAFEEDLVSQSGGARSEGAWQPAGAFSRVAGERAHAAVRRTDRVPPRAPMSAKGAPSANCAPSGVRGSS